MQPEEITAYIVEELAKYRNLQDIVLTVCEKTKMSWSDAEKLVGQVQSAHGREIAARQSPLLIILSVGSLVIGLGATCFGVRTLSLYVLFVGIGMTLGGIIGLRNVIADTKAQDEKVKPMAIHWRLLVVAIVLALPFVACASSLWIDAASQTGVHKFEGYEIGDWVYWLGMPLTLIVLFIGYAGGLRDVDNSWAIPLIDLLFILQWIIWGQLLALGIRALRRLRGKPRYTN